MSENLNFKPGYYKITELVEPNVLEVEDTWFIKLKGVGDHTPKEELIKWLKKSNIVRVVPYSRSNDARIISDVWLGNTHINRQFPNYKTDNFIQAFREWKNHKKDYSEEKIKAEKELIKAFYIAKPLISNKLEHSFNSWIESRYLRERTGSMPLGLEENFRRKEQARDQIIADFNNWIKNQSA